MSEFVRFNVEHGHLVIRPSMIEWFRTVDHSDGNLMSLKVANVSEPITVLHNEDEVIRTMCGMPALWTMMKYEEVKPGYYWLYEPKLYYGIQLIYVYESRIHQHKSDGSPHVRYALLGHSPMTNRITHSLRQLLDNYPLAEFSKIDKPAKSFPTNHKVEAPCESCGTCGHCDSVPAEPRLRGLMLEPCLACGRSAEIVEIEKSDSYDKGVLCYKVICTGCAGATPAYTEPQVAVQQWNAHYRHIHIKEKNDKHHT